MVPRWGLLSWTLAAWLATAAALRCDWTDSGLAHGKAGHVTAVSLGCGAGRVAWRYPQGAVRVSLDPSNAFDFRACIRVESGSSGARVFVEGPRRLELIWAEDDGRDPERWRCFVSRQGRASLYLEAVSESPSVLSRTELTFEYDAQPAETERLWDPLEDCRPCNDSEALYSFCTSDFVARGQIAGVEHDDRLDRTRLTVRAGRVIRQTNDLFRPSEEKHTEQAPTNSINNARYRSALLKGDLSDRSSDDPEDSGSGGSDTAQVTGEVYVPRHCSAHGGQGQYLLMGRHRLGVPMVTCSLAVDEWHRIKAEAEANFTNECILET